MHGYARVSTDEQSLDLQLDALEAKGVQRRLIVTEKVSGALVARPKLDLVFKNLRRGDTLVVWKLDRIARSLVELIRRIDALRKKQCRLVSVTESIDTESAMGQFVVHILGAVAEFERQLIAERTRAGVQARKARGLPVGRQRKLTDAQIAEAQKLRDSGEFVRSIAKQLNVSHATVMNYTRGPNGGRGNRAI
jgi:DNA invertase Pin-like site-specific DNA recombinase